MTTEYLCGIIRLARLDMESRIGLEEVQRETSNHVMIISAGANALERKGPPHFFITILYFTGKKNPKAKKPSTFCHFGIHRDTHHGKKQPNIKPVNDSLIST